MSRAASFELHQIPTHPALRQIPRFVSAVEACARDHALEAPELPADQRERLADLFGPPRPDRLVGHQMVLFWCLVAAHGRSCGLLEREVGAAFMLIQRGVSLIDKVQDGDREHLRRWAELGPGAALNAGITAMVLGMDRLWALEHRLPHGLSAGLRSTLSTHLLRMSAGQHRELLARPDRLPLHDRIEIAGQKATEFALLTELAGLCLGAVQLEGYRAIGHEFALMVQIANDLADLRRPGSSDDLRTGTWNIPLTLLLEALPPESARVLERRLRQPNTSGKSALGLLRQLGLLPLLHERVGLSCTRIEHELAAMPCSGPYLELLKAWFRDMLGAIR